MKFQSTGDLMSCEGSCMRAFHFGMEEGEDTFTDDACNPIAMPTDLARRLSVSLLHRAWDLLVLASCVSMTVATLTCRAQGTPSSAPTA